MAADSSRFPLHNAIKKILDDPASRPEIPGLEPEPNPDSMFPLEWLGVFPGGWPESVPVSSFTSPQARGTVSSFASPQARGAEGLDDNHRLSGSPAVAVFQDTLYCFYEGPENEGKLHYCTFDGQNWSIDTTLGNYPISGSPALAVFKDKLYCFYEGYKEDGWLHYFTFDGETWSDAEVTDYGTSIRERRYPCASLAVFKDVSKDEVKLYCVHEGQGNKGKGWLWYFTFDGETWSDDEPLSKSKEIGQHGTTGGGSLAAINERLYCLHEGKDGAGVMFYTVFDGSSWNKDHKFEVKLTGDKTFSPCKTSGPPGAIVYGDKIYWVHEGPGNDGFIWSFNNEDFVDRILTVEGPAPQNSLRTSGTPAIANYDNKFYILSQNNGQLCVTATQALLPIFSPNWIEDRGENGYCYYSTSPAVWDTPGELPVGPVVIRKTIAVDPGVSFLIANLSDTEQGIAFPGAGTTLEIKGPNGTIYSQEGTRGFIQTIKKGSSLQSLLIKEPMAGNYEISLTLPRNTSCFFAFQTLPFGDLDGILEGSQKLQKRDADRDREKQVANLLAMLWLIIAKEKQSLSLLEEPVSYVTKSEVDITDSKVPPDVVQATDIIAAPIFRILTIEDFRRPPATPTPAPVNGPVLEYVQNLDGALLWLHARITRAHLGTGTPTNQQTRNFAQRLGLRTDDAGHVIGNQLGGLGTVEWNIFPQNPNFNRGAYSHYVERVFRDAVQRYGQVEVWFRFHYNDANHPNRVLGFDFCMLLPDGTIEINDLYNPT